VLFPIAVVQLFDVLLCSFAKLHIKLYSLQYQLLTCRAQVMKMKKRKKNRDCNKKFLKTLKPQPHLPESLSPKYIVEYCKVNK